MFIKAFIEYITKRFRRHIGEAVGTKIKPGNGKRTITGENRLRTIWQIQ
jgi:hypothetical protein